MSLIRKQGAALRLISIVIVLGGVFATSPQDDRLNFNIDTINFNDGNQNSLADGAYDKLLNAAILARYLELRSHTKIDGVHNTFASIDSVRSDLEKIQKNRFNYIGEMVVRNRAEFYLKRESMKHFSASIEAKINTTFDRILGNDDHTVHYLNAQIIWYQLNAPMKVVQSLSSLAILRLGQWAFPESQFAHVIKQLKYKPRVLKEVLDDLDYLLRQESTIVVSVKRAIGGLINGLDQVLASDEAPTMRMMNKLSTEWNDLLSVIETEKSQNKHITGLLNRMQNLIKCSELGIAAYRQCRYNPTKLATFSAHVDKHRDHLQETKRYEHDIYSAVIPALKEIEKLSNKERRKEFDAVVSSVLTKVNDVYIGVLLILLYNNNDLCLVIEDTRQFNRQIISLLNRNHVNAERYDLLKLSATPIEHNDPKIKKQMERFNDEITISMQRELCMMAREALKMRVFAIDQDYLELCDLDYTDPNLYNSTHIHQQILRNLNVLEEKIKSENVRDRRGASFVFPNSTFTNERPFFVWKYRDYKNEITKLLSGELVTLNADVLAASSRNSVKFNKILLDFRLADKSKQNEFYNVISGLGVGMDIIGYNYYRCNERIYYVPLDSTISLEYQIKINGNNQIDAIKHGAHYPRVLDSKPFLSPYNTWQIGFNKTIADDDKYQKLKQFIGQEIDLHLIGVGSETLNYGEGKEVCNDVEVNYNYAFDRII